MKRVRVAEVDVEVEEDNKKDAGPVKITKLIERPGEDMVAVSEQHGWTMTGKVCQNKDILEWIGSVTGTHPDGRTLKIDCLKDGSKIATKTTPKFIYKGRFNRFEVPHGKGKVTFSHNGGRVVCAGLFKDGKMTKLLKLIQSNISIESLDGHDIFHGICRVRCFDGEFIDDDLSEFDDLKSLKQIYDFTF